MRLARRGRSLGVTGLLLAGGIGIISSTQTWLTVERTDAGEPILVPGAAALPLLATLSLAVLALGAALAIAGPILRHVFAVVAGAVALLLGWSTAQVLFAPPLSTVTATVTTTTGLAGDTAVDDIVGAIVPSAWPVLALVGWIILLLAAILVLVTARHWKAGGRRFRTNSSAETRSDGPVDAVDSWDDLSRGTDPTR